MLIWIRKRRLSGQLLCVISVSDLIRTKSWFQMWLTMWRQPRWMIRSCSWSFRGKNHWNYQPRLWRPSITTNIFISCVMFWGLKSWSPSIQMLDTTGLICTVSLSVLWGILRQKTSMINWKRLLLRPIRNNPLNFSIQRIKRVACLVRFWKISPVQLPVFCVTMRLLRLSVRKPSLICS